MTADGLKHEAGARGRSRAQREAAHAEAFAGKARMCARMHAVALTGDCVFHKNKRRPDGARRGGVV